MTLPPLPDANVIRVAMDYTHDSTLKAGSRFYLKYSGSTASSGDLGTLASDIATYWNGELAAIVNDEWTLTEVDCLDISTRSGNFNKASVSHAGSASGTPVAAQVAMNIEYNLALRYRGGKPRMYLPPSVTGNADSDASWTDSWVTTVNGNVAAFFAAVVAVSLGSLGTLTHVNLSYYHGFTNIANTSGRVRAVPTYRSPNAISTPVTGYSAKKEFGSQRRRRVSTTD